MYFTVRPAKLCENSYKTTILRLYGNVPEFSHHSIRLQIFKIKTFFSQYTYLNTINVDSKPIPEFSLQLAINVIAFKASNIYRKHQRRYLLTTLLFFKSQFRSITLDGVEIYF